MKRKIVLITLILTLCLVVQALAASYVRTTGSVNLRKGPGLGYGKVYAVPRGTKLEYLGKKSTDSRGVVWYKVRYRGSSLWVSSRYSSLKQDSAAPKSEPAAEVTPEAAPEVSPGPSAPPTFGPNDRIELSDFYLDSLSEAALALGLTNHGEDDLSELQNFYTNDALLIAGNDLLEHFLVTGPGYSIFGVYVGMEIDSARAVLAMAGLVQADSAAGVYYQHAAGEKSPTNVDGYDSGISIMTDAEGRVTEISWSTYSG